MIDQADDAIFYNITIQPLGWGIIEWFAGTEKVSEWKIALSFGHLENTIL